MEYSKQYLMIESFVFTSAHYTLPLKKQTSLKLLPKIIYGQVHVSDIYRKYRYPIRTNKLKMHDRQSQIV